MVAGAQGDGDAGLAWWRKSRVMGMQSSHGGRSAGFANRGALLGLVESEVYIRAAAPT
jgi:hypothetical protein